MRARDIMSRTVVSVTPEASVLEVAALMMDQRASAVVVVSSDAVVGIVSEADLLHRYELGTQRDPAARWWWHRLFDVDGGAWSYVEAHAMKIRDVMATQLRTVTEDTPAADIAALFDDYKIKQAPGVNARSVVGIVSRADFVRALVERSRRGPEPKPESDAVILRALRSELEAQAWWDADRSKVAVSDGVVHFSGQVNSLDEKAPARVAAENRPGVRAVEDSRFLVLPPGGYSGAYM